MTPLLQERQQTHGDFAPKSAFVQSAKDMMRATPGWSSLTPFEREALDMIALKIGRTLYGNPHEVDHWNDMAGYAELVVEGLK